jgi:hypothetical protein
LGTTFLGTRLFFCSSGLVTDEIIMEYIEKQDVASEDNFKIAGDPDESAKPISPALAVPRNHRLQAVVIHSDIYTCLYAYPEQDGHLIPQLCRLRRTTISSLSLTAAAPGICGRSRSRPTFTSR